MFKRQFAQGLAHRPRSVKTGQEHQELFPTGQLEKLQMEFSMSLLWVIGS